MSIAPLLVLACIGYAVYVFAVKKPGQDNPAMRAHYGLLEGDLFDRYWANGCVWLREISPTEKNVKAVANAAGLLLGVTVKSKLDSYTLSRTKAGVWVLKDFSDDGNRGTIRFSPTDIVGVTPLEKSADITEAAGIFANESVQDADIELTGGRHLWLRVPTDAYQLLAARA